MRPLACADRDGLFENRAVSWLRDADLAFEAMAVCGEPEPEARNEESVQPPPPLCPPCRQGRGAGTLQQAAVGGGRVLSMVGVSVNAQVQNN